MDRVVVLIDMDCFYCQVEEKLDPNLKGKPIAVVQYNQWQGGGIIAVNYLARAKGVTRHMRGDEAKRKCPDIELPSVPCVRGKADISKYREAGKDVAHVLQEYSPLLERASIDEAYLDITETVTNRIGVHKKMSTISPSNILNTYILGYDKIDTFINNVYSEDDSQDEFSDFDKEHSLKLLVGALVTFEIRSAVYEKTGHCYLGFHCSAGIAHNKIMAKLVCGMNKPNKQTVLPKNCVETIFRIIPVNKVKGLGGKFGELVCSKLKISKMEELKAFSEKELQTIFDEKNGSWLYNIARGLDNDPVTPRFCPKSIGCCKKFPGKSAIIDLTTLTHWLRELGAEIEDRVKTDSAENNRYPTQMVVNFTKYQNGKDVPCSRSINMLKEDITSGEALALNALSLIRKDTKPFCNTEIQKSPEGIDVVKVVLLNSIKFLGISVAKFEEQTENESKKKSIQDFFNGTRSNNQQFHRDIKNTIKDNNSENISTEVNLSACTSSVMRNDNQNSKNNIETNNNPESFIVKYLKSFNKPTSSLLEINPTTESKMSIAHDTKYESHEDNSVDSECSIELEINKSKQLSESDFNKNKVMEIESLRATFSIPKIESSLTEVADPSCEEQENCFIQCEECKEFIHESEINTHNDYHFALKIREEERICNPKTIKPNIISKPSPKKQFSKAKKRDIHSTSNIVSLFNKISRHDEAIDGSESETCSECGKNIKKSKILEHMDYHEAKKLHTEINEPKNLLGNIQRINHDQNTRTLSKTIRKTQIKTDTSNRTINSYFQK